jgi:hypothetical protein
LDTHHPPWVRRMEGDEGRGRQFLRNLLRSRLTSNCIQVCTHGEPLWHFRNPSRCCCLLLTGVNFSKTYPWPGTLECNETCFMHQFSRQYIRNFQKKLTWKEKSSCCFVCLMDVDNSHNLNYLPKIHQVLFCIGHHLASIILSFCNIIYVPLLNYFSQR